MEETVCLICCKPAKKVDGPLEKLTRNWLRLLCRHLGDEDSAKIFFSKPLETCVDCDCLLEEYGSHYHDWKCLELELYRKVDKIWEIMKLADRVPSRVKAFREFYRCDNAQDQSNFSAFRTKLKQNCKSLRLKSMPRVYLEKSGVKKELQNEDSPEEPLCATFIEKTSGFYGWFTSLAVVMMLSNFQDSWGNHPIQGLLLPLEDYWNVSNDEVTSENYMCWESSPPDNSGSEMDERCKEDSQDEDGASCGFEDGLCSESTHGQEEVPDILQCAMPNEEVKKMSSCPELESQPETTGDLKAASYEDTPVEDISLDAVEVSMKPSEENGTEDSRSSSNNSSTPDHRTSRLRKVFRCTKCLATFSSELKLEQHEKACDVDTGSSSDEQTGSSSSSENDNWEDSDDEISESEEGNSDIEENLEESSQVKSSMTPKSSTRKRPISNVSPGSLSKKQKRDAATLSKDSGRGRGQKLLCIICKHGYKTSEKLTDHKKSVHEDLKELLYTRQRVVSLPEQAITVDDFLNPQKTKFSCEPCKMGFMKKQNLESHQMHHGDFKCSTCDASKSLATQLASHLCHHIIQTDKSSQCQGCNDPVSKNAFIPHYLHDHLGLESDKVLCPICKIPVIYLNGKSTMNKFVVYAVNKHYLLYHHKIDTTDQEIFICKKPKCKAYFLTNRQLNRHVKVIHKKFECSECNECFPSESRLHVHRRSHFKKELNCPRCLESYKYTPSQLAVHMKTCSGKVKSENGQVLKSIRQIVISHPEDEKTMTIDDYLNPLKTKFSCKELTCWMGFTQERDLEIHKKLHGTFKCHFCDHSESMAVDIANHELSHAKGKAGGTVKCPRQCGNHKPGKKQTYVKHFIQDHLGLEMDKLSCPICDTSIFKLGRNLTGSTASGIAAHFSTYHDLSRSESGESFKCTRDNCKAYFLTKLQLARHIATIHEEKDLFTCRDCGKIFKKVNVLRLHRSRVHKVDEEDFEFICDKDGCEARFEREIELDIHRARHAWVFNKQFKCGEPNCEKSFTTRLLLRRHQRTHLKIHHVCEICKKIFKTKQKLQNHMMYHDPDNWKFVCSTCGKKSSTKSSLDEHMRSHSSVKSFVCQECGQGYVHKHNLRNHLKTKHGIVEPVRKLNRIYRESTMKGKKFKRDKIAKTC